MRKVAVIGIGMTKFGQLWKRDLTSLSVEAGVNAVRDAGIHQKDVRRCGYPTRNWRQRIALRATRHW